MFPLEGVSAANPEQGGFGYLEWNSYPGYPGDAFHPARDLNAGGWGDADCGSPVTAMAPGTVRAVLDHTSSYGLHVWIEHHIDWGGEWTHYCHLSECYYAVGERVERGTLLGRCGKSARGKATWPYCHLHFEVMRQRPPGWDFWPLFANGYTRDAVAALYRDPLEWLAEQDQRAAALVTPPPTKPEEMDVSMLTDEELDAIAKVLWGPTHAYNAVKAIDRNWREEWKAGRYRGRPKTIERPMPHRADSDDAVYREFTYGLCVYRGGQVSWNG